MLLVFCCAIFFVMIWNEYDEFLSLLHYECSFVNFSYYTYTVKCILSTLSHTHTSSTTTRNKPTGGQPYTPLQDEGAWMADKIDFKRYWQRWNLIYHKGLHKIGRFKQIKYSTRHNVWYSLKMIFSIPFLADPYVCFACSPCCWIFLCKLNPTWQN